MKNNMKFVTNGFTELSLLKAKMHTKTFKGYSGAWLIVMLLVVLIAGCSGGSNPAFQAPTVSSVTPIDGVASVAANTEITATFSTAMDPATITTATFTLEGAAAVTGTVTPSPDGLTATFKPDSILAANTKYTATIKKDVVKNLDGIALAADKVWSFTTAAAPSVVNTDPTTGETSVAVNKTISATFDKAMTPLTFDITTFTLTAGATSVTGAVAYDTLTKIATFDPDGDLTASTTYTATITTGVKAFDDGQPMAANKVWTFKTAP